MVLLYIVTLYTCVRACVRACACVRVCVLAIEVCARQYTYMNKLNDVHICVRFD